MSKRTGEKRSAVAKATAAQTNVGQRLRQPIRQARTGWQQLPTWAWVLVFVLPLALSEYMFYMGGRTANMVMFPIVWIGFWTTIWYRSGPNVTSSRRLMRPDALEV